MYKTIDIADIIGTVVHEYETTYIFPMERIECVFQKVALADIGDQLTAEDKNIVNHILDRIVKDGRIRISSEDSAKFIKL